MVTVSCGITIYHPEDDIVKKLHNYSEVFKDVYVFDNTEYRTNEDNWLTKELLNLQNVKYICKNENLGLPYAFNTIMDMCDDDFLCTLDQDSKFSNEDILSMIEKLNCIDDQIAIIAPKVIYEEVSNVEKKDTIKYRRFVITSGSFINLNIIKAHHIRYDENYFIDKFEIDFGQQLKNLNYKVCEYDNSILYQRLGENSGHKHPNHSVLRHYYLFRNRFYYNKKFIKSPIKRSFITIFQVIKHEMLIILFENDKQKKFLSLFVGYDDYRKGLFGKITRNLS